MILWSSLTVISSFPVGENTSLLMGRAWPCMLPTWDPVYAAHSFTSPSRAALAMWRPVGEYATSRTEDIWPRNTFNYKIVSSHSPFLRNFQITSEWNLNDQWNEWCRNPWKQKLLSLFIKFVFHNFYWVSTLKIHSSLKAWPFNQVVTENHITYHLRGVASSSSKQVGGKSSRNIFFRSFFLYIDCT